MMKKLALIFCLILGFGLSAKAQTTVALLPIPKPSFYGQNGLPLSGCKIFTYISGTSTPLGTFTDSTGTIPNPNPVTCDAGGFVNPGIWLIVGDTYRILVQDQFGVQQYLVDGVVGVGGGTLSLFSTPNTWTALQTFSGGASINGGTLTGTFTGSPFFSGTPQFTSFTISNSTVIANLNSTFWNGTSISGVPVAGNVPVATSGTTAVWGTQSAAQLVGGGITTINGTTCTIASSCTVNGLLGGVVYSTPSASSAANIPTTTMVTVGGSNATYRMTFYMQISVVGASCAAGTSVTLSITFQDPLAAAPSTISVGYALAGSPTFNGVLGPGYYFATGTNTSPATFTGPFRAKAGTAIQYATTYAIGTSCAPGPQYVIFPILEQVTTN